ncbi:xylosyltransferase oxt isoform X1 [Danaus plexippus]|uniref:xylosyltransferase oxt isoform X1 n=2 Tax=Danaus plexippus TaxID=13037 RepID=UPI002AB26949|nr:xylosyltransferase oxt isoform X1 [Danaus plexippus]
MASFRRIFYKYAKYLAIIVLTTFFAQLFISILFFPSIHDNLLKRNGYTSVARNEGGDASARKLGSNISDDEDFGSKTLSHNKPLPQLRLEELDFRPSCDIKSREAISAIHRAKTQKCKQEIVNKTCLIQNGSFYPKKLPNYCSSKTMKYGRHLGCFVDEKKLRLLSGFYGSYANANSPTFCLDICVQAGFLYGGVQYASECFCGDTTPTASSLTADSSCDMKCPGDRSKICGGYLTMNVYETGLDKFVAQIPKTPENKQTSVRIVFLLTLNGRALRQVHRLINSLYRENHYFYIHVDKRQDYLHRKLTVLEKQFPNIKLAKKQYSTIWGGASLLTMLLTSMKDILKNGWEWDYVINLSESDFPIKSLEELEKFLSDNKGYNFVKSHGREVQRFIKKQGLDKTFIECETHMWRVGERKLPKGIVIDGGSDWIALSPELVSYVVGERDELLSGLDVIFEHTLLPAESYFHTVLRNSRFCNTYVDNNLHVTNWKRKLGCKCQYKHVVDWCGCSPNDFKTEDWPRIQNTQSRQLFFARKFEPIINQEIITRVEQYIGFKDHYLIPNLEAYWQNIYDIEDLTANTDDTLLSHGGSIIRHNSKILAQENCNIEIKEIIEINLYKYADVYKGNLILHKATINNDMEVFLETWYKPKKFLDLGIENLDMEYIKVFKVSSDYDQKEMLFRNLANILGPWSEPVLLYQFSAYVDKNMGNLTLVWLDPAGVIADINIISRDENNLTSFIKPHIKAPLLPGVWRVGLFDNTSTIAVTKFLITPLEYFSGKEITQQEVGLIHGGSQNSYKYFDNFMLKSNTFIPSRENRLLLMEISKLNTRRINKDLIEWIDSLHTEFYNILGSCVFLAENKSFEKISCGNYKFQQCILSDWSSKSPDPKGVVGKLDKNTGRLKRM